MKEREQFGSRLGFLLVSAGCAVGMGNVWRFPYITGANGGGAFVFLYIIALILLGIPTIIMEIAVGRYGRHDIANSFRVMEKPGQKWHRVGYVQILGNVILMMFYTTLAGWCLSYVYFSAAGKLEGLPPEQIGAFFGGVLGSAPTLVFWMGLSLFIGILVCSFGLQKGVEKVSKIMMISLFILLFILIARSVTLPGAMEGLKFYLIPDFGKIFEGGFTHFVKVFYEAIGQAFFSLSVGMGGVAIFGSYISKDVRLTTEGVIVVALDTVVAILAGLVIFPACFAFDVNPGQGAGLAFVTLPNIFNAMPFGRFWGTLFFLLLAMAGMTTVIGVLENIYAFCMDKFEWTRKKCSIIFAVALFVLGVPTALGFNVLSKIEPMGEGTVILDLLDFIVSNNILPLGAMVTLLFCTTKMGWGFDNFLKEVNTGSRGIVFPKSSKFYITFVLPIIVFIIFIYKYITMFMNK